MSVGVDSRCHQQRKFVLGGCQNVPASDKYRKKLNVFIRVACGYRLQQ